MSTQVPGYGGSDTTTPSFNRPRYVKYNSISKSLDLGELRNLRADDEELPWALYSTEL